MCDRCAVLVREEWGLPSTSAIRPPARAIWRPAFSLATAAVLGFVAVATALVAIPANDRLAERVVAVSPPSPSRPAHEAHGPAASPATHRAIGTTTSSLDRVTSDTTQSQTFESPRVARRSPARTSGGIARARGKQAPVTVAYREPAEVTTADTAAAETEIVPVAAEPIIHVSTAAAVVPVQAP